MERVKEVQRTPLQLVWDVDDNFTRYIVHCCARYHEIVSFSGFCLLGNLYGCFSELHSSQARILLVTA
jgi:hypothetical protein